MENKALFGRGNCFITKSLSFLKVILVRYGGMLLQFQQSEEQTRENCGKFRSSLVYIARPSLRQAKPSRADARIMQQKNVLLCRLRGNSAGRALF